MKNYLLIIILIANFLFSNCGFLGDENSANPNNINIESISYELTYNNYSVIKVTIKTYDELENDVSFIAYLKSYEGGKEYILNCSSYFYDMIECYSQKDVTFDLKDKYYFYYNKTNSKITFDENDILEDDKKISLIFKPEISVDDKLYRDNKKIDADTGGNMVQGGFLYITKKYKKILKRPKDGFNKYIELKNSIAQVGYFKDLPLSTISGYRSAIRKGYHIVSAVLRFSKDNVPVICHEEDLEKVSDGTGKISSKTIRKLLKLDFGSKFNTKYEGERILTFEILLQLCKDYKVIIDLDLSYLDDEKSEIYAVEILNITKNYNMLNSVYFSGPYNKTIMLQLNKINNDISISVPVVNKKEEVDKINSQFDKSKRIIYSFTRNNVDEDTMKYIKSLGQKVKIDDVIDDKMFIKKVLSWGVDYIKTDFLHPFLIENEMEDPALVRCVPVDGDHSECTIDDDYILKDNEWYNIYYSENIYNISMDINEQPLGEFQYIDTNILDELYYVIDKFDFYTGQIKLNISNKLKKGESIYGIVGPLHDNVAEYYHYNFTCLGTDNYTVNCTIDKDENVKFEGNYSIYYLEDYSLNEFETEERGDFDGDGDGDDEHHHHGIGDNNYVEYIVEEKTPYFLIFCIVIIIIICLVVLYFCKFRKKDEHYNRIRMTDNNYISDDYLYR